MQRTVPGLNGRYNILNIVLTLTLTLSQRERGLFG